LSFYLLAAVASLFVAMAEAEKQVVTVERFSFSFTVGQRSLYSSRRFTAMPVVATNAILYTMSYSLVSYDNKIHVYDKIPTKWQPTC